MFYSAQKIEETFSGYKSKPSEAIKYLAGNKEAIEREVCTPYHSESGSSTSTANQVFDGTSESHYGNSNIDGNLNTVTSKGISISSAKTVAKIDNSSKDFLCEKYPKSINNPVVHHSSDLKDLVQRRSSNLIDRKRSEPVEKEYVNRYYMYK